MNDFLDRVTLSEIRCDTDGCTRTITVPNDIDESQAAAIARHAGWSAQLGYRWSHRCQQHGEVKR